MFVLNIKHNPLGTTQALVGGISLAIKRFNTYLFLVSSLAIYISTGIEETKPFIS